MKDPALGRRFRCILILLALACAAFVSCGAGSRRAVLWTDRPEFAFYADYFNASQDEYKIEVRYYEAPAQKLTEPGEFPDIVAASWLKSSSTRALFKPLDQLFPKDGPETAVFYPRLLSLGIIDGRQYLLPVSFNIPAVIFALDISQPHSNPFIMEMEEIKERSKGYNAETNGVYSRMGFLVSSNAEFLFLASTLFGVSFREASPVAWDSQALENCIAWLRQWVSEINTDTQAEDDFTFKYFYEPPETLINSGRVLYAHMDSASFFSLPEERRANLDFRWLAAGETIPLDESNVYYGIHKNTRSARAAEAFTLWFFNADTQRLLLEAAKGKRLLETSFGVAGGFSAMKPVTEQVFPLFYPALLGHMPPESYLSPANILPRNWTDIKARVILPYLAERIRHAHKEEVRSLERRISDWNRTNRE